MKMILKLRHKNVHLKLQREQVAADQPTCAEETILAARHSSSSVFFTKSPLVLLRKLRASVSSRITSLVFFFIDVTYLRDHVSETSLNVGPTSAERLQLQDAPLFG